MKVSVFCPICKNSDLACERYRCATCDVIFEGKVPTIDVPAWSEDDWNFVKTFLVAEGNLQLTGKTLGISYPTVKLKLAQINRTASRKEEPVKDNLQNVLKSLAAGNIDDMSAEEAVRKLMNIPKGKQGE